MRYKLRLFVSIFLLSSLDGVIVCVAQQDQVEPMEKTPVFRANVVTRTTKAVDYRHRGGSTKVDLRGTELMPQAAGEAKVESKTGRLEIDAKLNGMEPANKFGLEYLTYVLWAITPEGRANNLAEVVLDNGKSEMHATTDLQAFGLIITAEPYFAVTQPSDLVVAQNIVRSDTKGREEAIDVRYELLPKGLYASQVEPLRDVVYGIDRKAPLDLFEARNAARIARAAKAEQYAPSMSLKRQEEERVEKEKQAAAAREAQAKAEAEAQTQRRMQAETERASAEQAKAEAERAKQESDLAAQKAAQEKQEAQAAQAAALAQQQALQAESERARSQAEEAERGRQKAEAETIAMRARLLQQLNAILVTRDTARGLVATMPDVLFETNSFVLRPTARERLAKVAGILLAYPDLRLEVDGHTDSVGTEAYNQQLSEKRAASVRDYLAQQGIPISSVVVRGFGKTQPVASNATAAGRQQNRRVELVVSGEVIGTKIGGDSNAISTQPQP